MTTMRRVVAIILLVSLAGCDALWGIDDSGDGAEPVTAVVEPGLMLGLSAPDTVAAGEAFTVRFAVQNRTGVEVVVRTPNSCLVLPGVFMLGGDGVPFAGSTWACAAAITTHRIPAGEALTRTLDVQAVRRIPDGTVPAEPGSYTVEVSLSWRIDGEAVSLSTLGRRLRVRR